MVFYLILRDKMSKEIHISKISFWRNLAIIFIILFTLETLLFIWGWNITTTDIKNENKCNINICTLDKYETYYYDDFTQVCYCYKNDEIVYQEFLG